MSQSMIEQRPRALEDLVQDRMRHFHVPGVAVGVLHDGAEEVACFGVTSVEHPLPVDPDTLFQIGSITKTVTATAIVRLVERGRLELEAPVRRYLPDLRLSDADVTATITLRHLLTHTAGFAGDDFTDTGRGDDALARYVRGMAELPQVSPLGELFSYCNAGFCLLGRVIEVVTGTTYEQAIRELVLDPLGMAHSTFEPHEVMLHRFVVGHTSPFADEALDQVRVARPWALARAANPAGGLAASLRDLLSYARFHLGQGPADVLGDQARQTMQAQLAVAGNFADSVGTAWMLRDVGHTHIVEHGGATHGQQTALKLVPEHGFGLVILTNSSRGGELHGELAQWLLREHLGLQSDDPAPIDLPAERLAEYVGQYERETVSIAVSERDGGLVLQIEPKGGFPLKSSPPGPTPPPVPFAFWSEDRIVGLQPPLKGAHAEFVRNANGEIVWLRSGGRLTARQ